MRAVLLGALFVGAFDAIEAIVFFGLRSGVGAIRIFQSIAGGLLGRAAFQGGLATAALGLFLHFFIASSIVTTYYYASRTLPVLTEYVVVCGILYGLGVFVIMNQVVLPLSAAGRARFNAIGLANGLMIHAFGIGIPSALAARAARAPAADAAAR